MLKHVRLRMQYDDMTGVLMQRISRIPLSYRQKAKIPRWRFTVGPLNISDGTKRRNPVHASGRAAPVDEA